MREYCCVSGCKSKQVKGSGLSFHNFPRANVNKVEIENEFGILEQMDMRKAWQLKLQTCAFKTDSRIVCSLHFHKTDFPATAATTRKRPHMRKFAVPSQNLPTKSNQKVVKTRRTLVQKVELQERLFPVRKYSNYIKETILKHNGGFRFVC